ncbi:DMT family transporter [Gordonia sihwensis]|uniref:DMT family transporter n=1 Tax=Gordonia sihwensis TaxID=173559 RepID=UPI0005ED4A02|nr:DMT family transporter [Gordonia sihwensis]KJR10561.1 hypothetical protein UG54_00810 [Gordonia sihwensis]
MSAPAPLIAGADRSGLVPLLTAVSAVALWSVKPTLVAAVESRLGYLEVFVGAAVCALVVGGGVWIALCFRHHAPGVGAVLRCRGLLVNAGMSGAFLGLWYYGFYRALYTASDVDVSIISFSWPVIAAITCPYLVPGMRSTALRGWQWILIGVAAGGAGLVGTANLAASDGSSAAGLGWAVAAAVGSGIYLPFSLRALRAPVVESASRPAGVLLVVTIANMSALIVVLAGAVAVGGARLDFSHAGTVGWVLCAVIGLGIYLGAEVLWTWSVQRSSSMAVAALPYAVPIGSVLLLWAVAGQSVTAYAVLGMVIVVSALVGLYLSTHRRTKPVSAVPAEYAGTADTSSLLSDQ